MPDREKVRLMARLAMLEDQCGRQIRKVENTSRIDLITNPVWRWGFGITLLFFAAAGTFAILNMDMVLDAVAKDQTRNLIMIVLIAWLSALAVTIVVTFVLSYAKERRMNALNAQYRQMLQQLERNSGMSDGYDAGRGERYEDDLWDAPPSGRLSRRQRRREMEDNLDYKHMQVLEFEDDDYCYYVEAVPKRGGRRG